MGRNAIDQPKDFDKKIDQLVESSVLSIANDVEMDFFKGMSKEQILKTFYSRYGNLFVPTGHIETPKIIYRNSYAKIEELLDEDKKIIRGKWLDFRHKCYLTSAIAAIAILAAFIAQWLGLDIKIPGMK